MFKDTLCPSDPELFSQAGLHQTDNALWRKQTLSALVGSALSQEGIIRSKKNVLLIFYGCVTLFFPMRLHGVHRHCSRSRGEFGGGRSNPRGHNLVGRRNPLAAEELEVDTQIGLDGEVIAPTMPREQQGKVDTLLSSNITL